MKKKLVIVESPTKVKTLKKFLPKDFIVESSVGHIIDLPKKGFGIDVENDFEPTYSVLPDKKEVVKNLKASAKKVDTVYLAPDPDREGEAIAWHIASILPKGVATQRITFNEITKDAVLSAVSQPREIDTSLVNAQQARRLLDRIVGYKISPILQRRIQRGRDGFLSAGRVQSVALKLVVDREREIEAFIPIEYWQIGALFETDNKASFESYVYSVDGKKVEKESTKENTTTIPDQETAEKITERLNESTFLVKSLEAKEKKRYPVPPFITSTLQQEASRHYGFSATRTMRAAQSLYEGVDLGEMGTEGLITYMRTDSVRAAPEAISSGRSYIQSRYGKKFLPEAPKIYKTKSGAQDAHECIRPTNLNHDPEKIKSFLGIDEHKLYLLIWRRFLASQMNPAIYDTVTCDIEASQSIMLRSTGSIIKFQGFLVLYQEMKDQDQEQQTDQEGLLPPLKEGEALDLSKVTPKQSFTRPPARYSEATLVKALESSGIGRPSTYASIMNKIQGREYTTKEKMYLKPTELGVVACQMLVDNFQMIMNIDFTAKMEDDLDKIAENNIDWKDYLKSFWKDFIPLVELAEKEAFVPKIPTEHKCPKCGHVLNKVWSKNKYFYGCSNYPECDYTSSMEAFNFDKSDYAENFDWDQPCPKCGGEMIIRHGRFGTFLGCKAYPKCRGIVNVPKKGEALPEEMPDCPAVGCPGKLSMKKSRFGKTFFACTTYPDCDVIGNSIDQVLEKYEGHPRTKAPERKKKPAKGSSKSTKKTTTKKTRKAPTQKPLPLSNELSEIVEAKELSRPEVVKKTWDYIKKHNLQDPNDKKLIVPDEKLAKVFGSKEPIKMTQLLSKLSKHINK